MFDDITLNSRWKITNIKEAWNINSPKPILQEWFLVMVWHLVVLPAPESIYGNILLGVCHLIHLTSQKWVPPGIFMQVLFPSYDLLIDLSHWHNSIVVVVLVTSSLYGWPTAFSSQEEWYQIFTQQTMQHDDHSLASNCEQLGNDVKAIIFAKSFDLIKRGWG